MLEDMDCSSRVVDDSLAHHVACRRGVSGVGGSRVSPGRGKVYVDTDAWDNNEHLAQLFSLVQYILLNSNLHLKLSLRSQLIERRLVFGESLHIQGKCRLVFGESSLPIQGKSRLIFGDSSLPIQGKSSLRDFGEIKYGKSAFIYFKDPLQGDEESLQVLFLNRLIRKLLGDFISEDIGDLETFL